MPHKTKAALVQTERRREVGHKPKKDYFMLPQNRKPCQIAGNLTKSYKLPVNPGSKPTNSNIYHSPELIALALAVQGLPATEANVSFCIRCIDAGAPPHAAFTAVNEFTQLGQRVFCRFCQRNVSRKRASIGLDPQDWSCVFVACDRCLRARGAGR